MSIPTNQTAKDQKIMSDSERKQDSFRTKYSQGRNGPLTFSNDALVSIDGNRSDETGCTSQGLDNFSDDDSFTRAAFRDEAVLPSPLDIIETPMYYLEPIDSIPIIADISEQDIQLLHKAHHDDPFSILGSHFFSIPGDNFDYLIIRCWRKDAKEMSARPLEQHHFSLHPTIHNEWVPMIKKTEWLFQKAFRVYIHQAAVNIQESDATSNLNIISHDNVTQKEQLYTSSFYYDLKVRYDHDPTNQEFQIRDAYNFNLILRDYDLNLFSRGSCWHVDNLMGSHIVEINRVTGVLFSVWAPAAQFVSLVGDLNQWDGRAHPMRKRLPFGVWELFIPNIGANEKYGYRIYSKKGKECIKIDAYAQEFENPPATASIVSSCDDAYKTNTQRFHWTDTQWMRQRATLSINNDISRIPMVIYEVHLPSWIRGDNNTYLGYRELAERLIKHAKQLNITHIEFLPLAHHPFEGSWGYQVSGLYAPYSRLGNPDDLKYLINELHRNNIGVFLDFVPAHFVKDTWGLVQYDGEACYEYQDPREGEHKGWGTMMFNFRRNEVRAFLLGAAYHWLRRYHIDGLRIDAVSSMIYKNHCRDPGDWLPNEYGGDTNLQAISFLQELNWVIHQEFPGVFTMAEESTSWRGVTNKETGLGFDAKWDLGWMNDTLSYLCTPALNRWQKHSKLTFRGMYMAHENWVLPLSHDEVVSGKGSLLDKCGFSGVPFIERLRTLRALYGFQVGMPGRPLIFMGCEFGQGREWNESRSIDWHEAEEPDRKQTMEWVTDLFGLYRNEKALHAGDDEIWNFQWVDCDNAKDNIVAWIRKYKEWSNMILVICNFSGVKYSRYPVGVPHGPEWVVLLNSDDWKYGGEMHGPGAGMIVTCTTTGRLGWPWCLWIDIPAFGCVILKVKAPESSLLDESFNSKKNISVTPHIDHITPIHE